MNDELKKLDAGQKHLLKLIAKEQACPDGWNTKTRAIRVNVWNNGKLMRKADWLAAAQ